MKIDIAVAEKLLNNEPVSFDETQFPLLLRLKKSLIQFRSGCGSEQDIAILVRQILRFNSLSKNKDNNLLSLSKDGLHISKPVWESFGLLHSSSFKAYYLRAKPWQPTWLKCNETSPEDGAYSYSERRNYKPLIADPFIEVATGYSHYHNSAQRDAVRALLTMPESSTLAINIPTGAGKSMLSWLPSALSKSLCVVIVPTTSLAIDQEASLYKRFGRPLAYYSGQDLESIQNRKIIRERIKNGEQRVLFTSPESLSTSLFDALLESAKNKHLSHFVIDEAHMVYEWGNDFRPFFLKMAGVRKALIRKNKNLKTVLLSATLTSSAIELLKCLFKMPGPFEVFSSTQLRPEPSYWFKHCNVEEKLNFIKEAIHYLPRPLIIYTSLVKEAQEIFNKINSWGFRRVGLLTGDSSNKVRNELVGKWKVGEIEIVVGTSAFGLGIDQAHVRTVIHACIPDSIDRYYQEVGRGGRDGRASISLVLYTNNDIKAAIGLSADKLLSTENGWLRWQKLFENKHVLDANRYQVDLTVKPRLEVGKNEKNEEWNLKTLLLMVQAGLIILDEERLEIPKKTYDQFLDEQNWENYRNYNNTHQTIEVINPYHLNEVYWKESIEAIRQQIKMESRRSLKAMFNLLNEQECVGDILKDYYQCKYAIVVKACGGCFNCRENNKEILSGSLPRNRFFWKNYELSVTGDLKEEFNRTRKIFIFYKAHDKKDKNWNKKIIGVIDWLLRQGVTMIISDQLSEIRKSKELEKYSCFLFDIHEAVHVPPVPRLKVIMQESTLLSISKSDVYEIFIIPYESTDPRNKERLLIDVISAPDKSILLSHFVKKYQII